MTLSKREFMEVAWIHISKRVPEGTFFDQVFCYNSKTGYFSSWPANLAKEYAELLLSGKEHDLSWDRVFTHWMPPYPPNGGITYADFINNLKQETTKTRRRS